MDIPNPSGFFRDFPGLTPGSVSVTSEASGLYNCIAWAAGAHNRWWWPSRYSFWPEDAPREVTLEAFIEAYGSGGFSPVNDGTREDGIQKIAIYMLDGEPTHAARQLVSGRWTSKCGENVDIEHELSELEGPCYGTVAQFLGRAHSEF